MQYYSDKVVFITGATSGLGLSTVGRLRSVPGCRIIAAGRSAGKLKEAMGALSTDIKYLTLDLSESDDTIKRVIDSAFEFHGRIDVLINCAGMGFRGTVLETQLDIHRRIMQVDYFGQVAVIKAITDHWAQSDEGRKKHIIQISSVQGYIGIGERAPYSAAKHALVGFIDSMRTELDGGLHLQSETVITLVCPGYIRTNHSANALTGTGETYNRQDESTAMGESPDAVAHELLIRAANLEREVIIADSKIRWIIVLRYLAPSLCFRILRNRYLRVKESFLVTVYRWLRNM